MTALVIGEERIEIKWAKRKVIFNLKMLNDRLSALDANSSEHARMRAFYSKKIDGQAVLLEWLHRFDIHPQSEPVIEIQNECASSREDQYVARHLSNCMPESMQGSNSNHW